jgi:hypothetical protein
LRGRTAKCCSERRLGGYSLAAQMHNEIYARAVRTDRSNSMAAEPARAVEHWLTQFHALNNRLIEATAALAPLKDELKAARRHLEDACAAYGQTIPGWTPERGLQFNVMTAKGPAAVIAINKKKVGAVNAKWTYEALRNHFRGDEGVAKQATEAIWAETSRPSEYKWKVVIEWMHGVAADAAVEGRPPPHTVTFGH